MRILHVANGRLFGGIEQVLVTLAASTDLLKAIAFEFAVCAEGRLLDELRARGATVHPLGHVRLSRPLTIWRARQRLRAVLQSGRYGAVVTHAPWTHALFGDLARRHGAATVFWLHDAATGTPLIERRARAVRADVTLCNSRWTAQCAARVQPDAPARVVYYPVPPAPAVTADERQHLRASLGATGDEPVIVSAGRFEPYKGHVELVRALGAIRDLRWVLWVAGRVQRPREQTYVNAITTAAREAGVADRVRFIGERTDMAAVFAASDILAQANVRPEPFGLVFAEALLAGTPVVTTDMGGAPEIVDDTCGRLVPPGDAASLSAALRALVADVPLRRALAARGPAHASERCAPRVAIPLIEQTLLAVSRPAAA